MVFTWNKKTRFGPGWRLTGKEIPAHVVNIADIAGYLAPFDESNAALPRGDKSSFLKKMAFTRFKKKTVDVGLHLGYRLRRLSGVIDPTMNS